MPTKADEEKGLIKDRAENRPIKVGEAKTTEEFEDLLNKYEGDGYVLDSWDFSGFGAFVAVFRKTKTAPKKEDPPVVVGKAVVEDKTPPAASKPAKSTKK